MHLTISKKKVVNVVDVEVMSCMMAKVFLFEMFPRYVRGRQG